MATVYSTQWWKGCQGLKIRNWSMIRERKGGGREQNKQSASTLRNMQPKICLIELKCIYLSQVEINGEQPRDRTTEESVEGERKKS